MQQTLQDLIEKRRNRAITIVLGVKEKECDQYLSAVASQKLRKVILDQFNEFSLLVRDVMDSLDTGDVVLNDVYIEKIDQIHSAVVGNGKR
jgi:hypothetical protein